MVSAGAGVLDTLHATLTRYVILPSPEAADAVVLWIAATHGQPAWEHATRLAIGSPEKRCGKSRLLEILVATCRRPLPTVNISPAALVRSVGADDPPVLLLDEADTIFGAKVKDSSEDLRGIINAGHTRGWPYRRWDAAGRRMEECPCFCMAALAGIGDLPGTITDRAVVIKMRRRAPGEMVAPYRQRRDAPALHQLRDQVGAWVRSHLDELRDAEPAMPVEDRAADTWEPLIALADQAGGHWPGRARRACRVLVAEAEADDSEASLSLRLLSDIRDLFAAASDPVALFGDAILGQLRQLDAAPWGEFFGHELTAREMARMLRPYGLRSKDVWIAGTTRKGYRREELTDVWARYLPPLAGTPSARSARSASPQISPLADSQAHPLGPLGDQRPGDAPSGPSGQANGSASTLASHLADLADPADTPPGGGWPPGSNGAASWPARASHHAPGPPDVPEALHPVPGTTPDPKPPGSPRNPRRQPRRHTP